MKHFLSINDISDIKSAISTCQAIKKNPYLGQGIAKGKTLGLIFLNPSLRTKISTIKAAQNLGFNVLPIDVSDAWALEYNEGAIMDQDKAEHIKEAAAVIGRYCDIIAIRAFAKLKDKEEDEKEQIFQSFVQYAGKPVVNLESALRHPLQTLADILTIESYREKLEANKKPKVVLSWAPHVKTLPHAVANSFVEGIQKMDYEFVITHPEGYELDDSFTKGVKVEYDQEKAFFDADFIYVKNWSSVKEYGKVINQDKNWMIDHKKLLHTNQAKVMHCLPVRRNLVIADEVLDSEHSVVIEQAENRLYSAQYVLAELLHSNNEKLVKNDYKEAIYDEC